jgi:hypothetical protein
MTVRELIERLQVCDQEATVYLSDWQEGCAFPCPEAAAQPLLTGTCPAGPFVILGEEYRENLLQVHPEYPLNYLRRK